MCLVPVEVRGHQIPRTGTVGSCELPDADVGSQT